MSLLTTMRLVFLAGMALGLIEGWLMHGIWLDIKTKYLPKLRSLMDVAGAKKQIDDVFEDAHKKVNRHLDLDDESYEKMRKGE